MSLEYGNLVLRPMSEITLLLDAMSRGERRPSDELLPLVYDELRRLAAARMAQAARGQTLQPTALVHEAWLRLNKGDPQKWQNSAHFFNAAAEAMRHIVIENARRKSRLKHGGDQVRLDIETLEITEVPLDDSVLMIDDALERLKAESPERARVVVLKFFGGLTNREVAETLGVTERTVERQWAYAKVWLCEKIREQA